MKRGRTSKNHAYCSGFRVQGLGLIGFKVQGLGLRVQGLGFGRVQGLGRCVFETLRQHPSAVQPGSIYRG